MTKKSGRPANEPGIPVWKGAALKMRRIAAGYSLEDFSSRLKVSKSTVHRWEVGTNCPTSDHLEQICRILGAVKGDFSRDPKVL
jgi:transcriptional regulator with XRE-family HTH domain